MTPAKEKEILAVVHELAEPLCEAEGLELVHAEYQREPSGRTLRLYIDRKGGVSLDDCADVSRQVGDMLDVRLQGDESYRLEVSSPGVDRPVGRLSDFDRFAGNQIKIRINAPVKGQKNFTGILCGVSGDNVELEIDEKKISLAYHRITKARLINYNGES